MYSLFFKNSAKKEIEKLDNSVAERIYRAIKTKLLKSPETAGKRLIGTLNQYWSFRVGDHRVLYTFNDYELWVLVVKIGHRKEIYKEH